MDPSFLPRGTPPWIQYLDSVPLKLSRSRESTSTSTSNSAPELDLPWSDCPTEFPLKRYEGCGEYFEGDCYRGVYRGPSSPQPIHASWHTYQADDSAPSSGYSTYDSESQSPSSDHVQSGSWFAAAQDHYLARAHAAASYLEPTFPSAPSNFLYPIPSIPHPQRTSSSWDDQHPAVRRRTSFDRSPASVVAPVPRYPPARNLYIVVPPLPNYGQTFQASAIDGAVPLLDPCPLGSPFTYQPKYANPPSPDDLHLSQSSYFNTTSPGMFYPTPTPPTRSTFEPMAFPRTPSPSHYYSQSNPFPYTPLLASIPFPLPPPSLNHVPRAPSHDVDSRPHLPSPPATPSTLQSPFTRSLISNNGNSIRPFPSVLSRSPAPAVVDDDAPRTKVKSPPQKRIRPSRAKPKANVVPAEGGMKPLRFVNFTQKDSTAIVSAVAPSGPLRASSKRARELDA